jgi:hypothetical protein
VSDARLQQLQIPLRRDPRRRQGFHPCTFQRPSDITRALPVYYTLRGKMAHRVRHAQVYFDRPLPDNSKARVCIQLWCGQNGNLNKWGRLVPVPPDGWPLCGTCEGRAVGAGYPGVAILETRYELLYSPREGRAVAPAAAAEAAG